MEITILSSTKHYFSEHEMVNSQTTITSSRSSSSSSSNLKTEKIISVLRCHIVEMG